MGYRSKYMVACLGYSPATNNFTHVRYVTEMKDSVPMFGAEKKPLLFRNITEANAVRDGLAYRGWTAITIAAPKHYNLDNQRCV